MKTQKKKWLKLITLQQRRTSAIDLGGELLSWSVRFKWKAVHKSQESSLCSRGYIQLIPEPPSFQSS